MNHGTGESERLFLEAQQVLSGGVSSPVRAFQAVGGHPRFIQEGNGSRIVDVDGNEYIDMVMSWGPLLHGHAAPRIVGAVHDAALRGTSFGAPSQDEVRLAQLIRSCMPSTELLRFVSSGTEAAMSALRLARGFTGRDLIVKFDGCYHGHVDGLLVSAGSGALTHGDPTSAGISRAALDQTRVLPYNDINAVNRLFVGEGEEVAAVIVEPVAGNMGTVPPRPGFLEALRLQTGSAGALLIFDEVITGFRIDSHGAQGVFDIRPDLTCLGKIIGGGLPAAALGGRRDIMELLSPLGAVYQAGTLSGNPLAMAAGLEAVALAAESDYGYLESLACRLQAGLADSASRHGVPVTVNRAQSMLSCFFTDQPVVDLASARSSDVSRYAAFFNAMLDQGVYLPPSQFETWMVSFAHTADDVERVLEAADSCLAHMAGVGGEVSST